MASIVVVSTAKECVSDVCRRSIFQQDVQAKHITLTGPKAALENLYEAVGDLKPDTIVVWLDGDDYLACPDALARIERAYADHPRTLVTYGQFIWRDGSLGFARQARLEELLHPRKSPWIYTHLRTFKAGLFHLIMKNSLIVAEETWLEPTDMAVMFPLIEMAGPDRVKFIPNVLCVYTGSGGDKNSEDYIRSLTPYKPLASEVLV